MTWHFPSFSSPTAKGNLYLSYVGWSEPNNGRELFEVRLLLSHVDVTQLYFDSWNYIPTKLDKYVPVSNDKKWIYIPKEGDHFLINAETLEKITLPGLELSAATFIGNMFIGDRMLVVGSRQVISINLLTGSVIVLNRPDTSTYFKDVVINNEHSLAVLLGNGMIDIVSIDTLQSIIKKAEE